MYRTALYTVSQQNDTDLAHYNFNAYQPILVIFGGDVAEWVRYWMVICYPTCPNYYITIGRVSYYEYIYVISVSGEIR